MAHEEATNISGERRSATKKAGKPSSLSRFVYIAWVNTSSR